MQDTNILENGFHRAGARWSPIGSGRLSRQVLASVLIAPLCLAFATAFAQQSPAEEEGDDSATLEEIIVTASGSQVRLLPEYAGGQVARGGRAGIFGNLDMMDSPFTSTNFTADLIMDQQARGVGDVLLNDPAVRVARGFGNFQELFMIRGFPTYSDDMLYNGIFGILPRQFVAAELLERVELFRGANSFVNGAAPGGSNVGGAVNLVPKRAPEEPLTRLTLGFEEQAHGYAGLDVGRRFGRHEDHGIRVNVARRAGETAVDDQDRELTVLALGYDFGNDRLRLSADLGYQDHRIDAPRPSVTPVGAAIPEAPDASSNFGQPWTLTEEEQLFGVVRGEYDLTDSTTIWAAAGGRQGEEFNALANPNAAANGDTTSTRFDNYRDEEIFSADAGLRTEFETGGIGHRLILSASVFSLESKNAYAFGSFAGFPNSLYNPTVVVPPTPDAFVGGDMNDPHVTFTSDTSSVAIADMISLMDGRVLLTVGARYQNLENESFDYNTGASVGQYDEGRVTPVGAVVVRYGEQISFYGNYAEGLVPGEVAPALSGGVPVDNAGEVFKPYQSRQYEVGVKYDGGDFGGTLSALNIEMPSSFVEDNVFSPAGEQRNRGFELTFFGELIESVRVLGGITLLDAEATRTQGNLYDGNDAIGVPDTQINVNVEWDLPAVPNLTLESRGVYTSSQWADQANTLHVPSWSRFDVGARYAFEVAERPLSLRARIDNVTDSDDWVSAGGYPGSSYLVLGAPRTLVISASMDF